MAKLERKKQLILGNTSSLNEITRFATPRTSPAYSKDVAILQGVGVTGDNGTKWEEGWFEETQDGNYRPYAEDRNAVDYVVTSQLAYIFQQGIPEWETNTDYYIGSLVKYETTNGTKLYRSIINSNQGNNPTTTGNTYWNEFTLGEDDAGMVGEVRMYAGTDQSLASSKWMLCRGQELSKTDYASLYSVIGNSYGGASEGNTFNLPNFQFRIPFGVGTTGSYADLGYQFGSLDHAHGIPPHYHSNVSNLSISGASGSHTHTVNDPGHNHYIHYKQRAGNAQSEQYLSSYVNGDERGSARTAFCRSAKTDISLNNSTHTHDAGSFSGTIGNNTEGVNGDSQVTSQTSNPPCLCINFIIKVK